MCIQLGSKKRCTNLDEYEVSLLAHFGHSFAQFENLAFLVAFFSVFSLPIGYDSQKKTEL